MKTTTTTVLLLVLVLGLGVAFVAPASTGEEGGGGEAVDPAAIQAWWMKMAAPGENHRWMDFLEGAWTVDGTFWMGPGEPMRSEGEAVSTWVMGRRYVRTAFTSTFGGMPFEGEGTMGFNNATGEYENVWMDNMSTFLVGGQGRREGDVVTFRSRMPSPSGTMDSRDLLTKVDDDTYRFESHHAAPGQPETLVMKLVYTRKPKAE